MRTRIQIPKASTGGVTVEAKPEEGNTRYPKDAAQTQDSGESVNAIQKSHQRHACNHGNKNQLGLGMFEKYDGHYQVAESNNMIHACQLIGIPIRPLLNATEVLNDVLKISI